MQYFKLRQQQQENNHDRRLAVPGHSSNTSVCLNGITVHSNPPFILIAIKSRWIDPDSLPSGASLVQLSTKTISR